MAEAFSLGHRLSFDGALCTVRYFGPVDGTSGQWLGVEWDDVLRGKHSGEHRGQKYFDCSVPNSGSFIRPNRKPDETVSFLTALRQKYASGEDPNAHAAISISASKVMEEVGFDKIMEKLSHLGELRIVILDGWTIDRSDELDLIQMTCPKIEELDLSRNLFESMEPLAKICGALQWLKVLRISGNQLCSLQLEGFTQETSPFRRIHTLELNNTFLSFPSLSSLLTLFPSLTTLHLAHNSISSLGEGILPATLTTLSLSSNLITSLSSISSLSSLPYLSNLALSHNHISSLHLPPSSVFPSLDTLDLSYNALPAFQSLDALVTPFPALVNLRVSHNPLFESVTAEEGHMLVIARTPSRVTTINHSRVSSRVRENAEMWYMGRVVRELAIARSDGDEEEAGRVLRQHGRWKELCEVHGEPDINREEKKEDRTLAGRVVELDFVAQGRTLKKRMPRVTQICVLRGLAGRWFGITPFHVSLRCSGVLECGKVIEEEEVLLGMASDAMELGMVLEGRRGRILVESSI